MAQASIKDKEITEPEVGLLNNENLVFIENASILLSYLAELFQRINVLINNDRKLKGAYLMDYKRLEWIKRGLAAKRSKDSLMEMLRQQLDFINRYDKELAMLISNKGDTSGEFLASVSIMAKEPSKVYANIDILLEGVDKLEDSKLRSRIKAILTLMKRQMDEAKALRYYSEDVNNWSMHVHDDITFFTERVDSYFRGSKPEGREGFTAIDSFRDEELKKSVYAAREIRMLRYITQFTYRVEAQIGFITRLISGLQTDIEENQWIRNVATKKFLDELELHANKFRTEFRNSPFADSLIANKKRIGEQPFEWISLLQKMANNLTRLIQMKSAVIENARAFLANAFSARITALNQSFARLSIQLAQTTSIETEDSLLLRKIKEGIERVEKRMKRRLEEAKKRIGALKEDIENLTITIQPEFEKAVQMSSLTEEGAKLTRSSEKANKFFEHMGQVSRVLRSRGLNANSFEYLGILLFDAARLQDLIRNKVKAQETIKEKERRAREYDLSNLKSLIWKLLSLYLEFVNALQLGIAIVGIDYESIKMRINKFLGEYYG